ncbi:UNVERIFIED_CONTAM: tRNA (cytosine(38)-C(5))-methyltransferase 2 [Sesamum latifolium]|uniref:tRNA (Cytosine(38)-C(5))-methyltransferase 2 n=1 Tax=Sesamum latifolium TaxID=2727402 RepID=A0AAW2X0B8_9LAMI
MEEVLRKEEGKPWRVLEFYSGIGGMTSDTHKRMIAMLRENHFDTLEFILSPLQFGVPYSRPRYFCLGKMKDKVSSLQELRLRYFTPREVANLHSFPEDFQFPGHVSLRQRYALLGNSLSVGVVAPLFHYLFTHE